MKITKACCPARSSKTFMHSSESQARTWCIKLASQAEKKWWSRSKTSTSSIQWTLTIILYALKTTTSTTQFPKTRKNLLVSHILSLRTINFVSYSLLLGWGWKIRSRLAAWDPYRQYKWRTHLNSRWELQKTESYWRVAKNLLMKAKVNLKILTHTIHPWTERSNFKAATSDWLIIKSLTRRAKCQI